jgi:hypothetical protein
MAIDYSWVCDDAFISFRYAKNLADGHGLVFNVGERVEGYTNFLWTVIMAAGMSVGFDPVDFSRILGIISFLGIVILLGFLSYRLYRKKNHEGTIFIPITSICLLVHRDFQVYATGGLETSWVTLLAVIGFAFLLLAGNRKYYFAAGLALIMAAASRPDALIFYIMGIVYLAFTGKNRLRNLILYLIPLILLYVPYWLIRYNYYGYPFPNTFYAKLGDMPYYSQGFRYLWLYFKTYYVFLLVIPIIFWIIKRWLFSGYRITKKTDRPLFLSFLFVIPFMFYVARVGGDFMFARFLIPVTPFLFFIIDMTVNRLIGSGRIRIIATVLVVALVVLRYDQFAKTPNHHGITDEVEYYPSEKIETVRNRGALLKECLASTDVRIAFYGAHAMYAYYSEVPFAIESDAGLTDAYIAHLPLKTRGRIGHEKSAPLDYLAEREVNFLFRTTLPYTEKWDHLRIIAFGDYKASTLVYKNSVMDSLKGCDAVDFVYLPDFLNKYIDEMAVYDHETVKEDYLFFDSYYFSHNDDTLRQNHFIKRLYLDEERR